MPLVAFGGGMVAAIGGPTGGFAGVLLGDRWGAWLAAAETGPGSGGSGPTPTPLFAATSATLQHQPQLEPPPFQRCGCFAKTGGWVAVCVARLQRRPNQKRCL